MVHHALNWFEIPAVDLDRAVKFYCAVLGLEQMEQMETSPGYHLAMFPYDFQSGGVGGGLVRGEGYVPSTEGALIYLNAGDDLAEPLARVEEAGGRVVMPKTDIGENGFMAYIIDTEGNRVGLHSMN